MASPHHRRRRGPNGPPPVRPVVHQIGLKFAWCEYIADVDDVAEQLLGALVDECAAQIDGDRLELCRPLSVHLVNVDGEGGTAGALRRMFESAPDDEARAQITEILDVVDVRGGYALYAHTVFHA